MTTEAGTAPREGEVPPGANADEESVRRSLRTIAILQTTLEIEPLLRLFSRELGRSVTHTGFSYRNPHCGLDLSVGRQGPNTRRYRLVVQREDLGEITFSRDEPFTEQEQNFCESLLSVLVYPLRNALRYREAVQASLTDPMTGVYNRHFMDVTLRREIGLARRHCRPLSVVMVDLNGLKAINDQLGHHVGDEVIRTVAGVLGECLRRTDVLARYGGDEFLLVLTNTGTAGAEVVTRHLREAIDGIEWRPGEGHFQISVSIGAASLGWGDGAEDLLARADAALYAAKQARRRAHPQRPLR